MSRVKAIHFLELRERIDLLREGAGLPRFGWTDPILTPGVTPVRRVHVLELCEALAEAYAAAGRPAPAYADTALPEGTVIRAAYLMELRRDVVELEGSPMRKGSTRSVALALTGWCLLVLAGAEVGAQGEGAFSAVDPDAARDARPWAEKPGRPCGAPSAVAWCASTWAWSTARGRGAGVTGRRRSGGATRESVGRTPKRERGACEEVPGAPAHEVAIEPAPQSGSADSPV